MKKVAKIIVICLLITITISTIFFLNKKEAKKDGMFAIMLETAKGTGKYEHAGNNAWPTSNEYVINMYKTYCEKGSVLRWNEESKRINVTAKGTDKCYVYFDISEYGNEEHPYLIQTIEDLVRLSNDVNGGTNYAGKYFLLTTDLDFQDESDYEDATRTDFKDLNGINGDEALIEELTTGKGFVPIGGSEANAFQGILDGNNHYIKNLYINNEEVGKNLGLFANIKNGKIENMNLTGQIKSSTYAISGGIVSLASGNVEIKNCQTDMEITGFRESTDSNAIGGMIGIVAPKATIQITDSKSSGNLFSGKHASGFIGWNRGTVSIKNCENLANVGGSTYNGGILSYNGGVLTIEDTVNKGHIEGESDVGGLVAANVKQLLIKNSVNYGEVSTTSGTCIGGLLSRDGGNTTTTEIINSHNEGKVIQDISTGNSRAGGITGRIQGSITIENSYNAGTISSKIDGYTANSSNMYGGLVGRKENTGTVIINKSYNSGDIEIIGNSYTAVYIGGLIGDFYGDGNYGSKLYILNSYNKGSITNNLGSSSRKGGLIGELYNKSSAYIINSYNIGAASGFSYVGGILVDNSPENIINNITMNNIFNLGNLNCDNNFEIYYTLRTNEATTAKLTFENVYYNEDLNATNRPNISFTPKAKNDMLTQAFVDELNSNIKNIDLGAMDTSLKNYKLSSWQLGSDNYPTLINE